jgi:predicted dehydrogenase
MADVFPQKQNASYDKLKSRFADRVDVPQDRRFLGFDAYRKAMDTLKRGDVVILATPPAFRWVHFTYAIEKGLHTFMEKAVTVDGPTTRRVIALGEQASKKNLKVGVGLMIRHCRARQELHRRIRGGEIGDIGAARAAWAALAAGAPAGRHQRCTRRSGTPLWASGGVFNDYNIHQIDERCWMKGAAGGGARGGRRRIAASPIRISTPTGTPSGWDQALLQRPTCRDARGVASYAHGTKGSAIISTLSHEPGYTRIFKGHKLPRVSGRKELPPTPDPNLAWAFPQPEKSPYQWEWDDHGGDPGTGLQRSAARRGGEPGGIDGRMAAHTGRSSPSIRC